MEFRKGHFEKAFALLRLAVQRDDSLRYDEPWGWMMPVRHSLGALLTEQRFKEAWKRSDIPLATSCFCSTRGA